MTRSLPKGIPYEVTIRKRNGRWWASIAYWQPPMAPPQRETQSVGGVDVGISLLAVDSGGEHPNPEAHYQPVQTSNVNWQYPTRGRMAGPRRLCVAGSGHRLAARQAAGAGGKLSDASIEPAAGRRDCATMPTTTSAGRWSASTTPSVSRRRTSPV